MIVFFAGLIGGAILAFMNGGLLSAILFAIFAIALVRLVEQIPQQSSDTEADSALK